MEELSALISYILSNLALASGVWFFLHFLYIDRNERVLMVSLNSLFLCLCLVFV